MEPVSYITKSVVIALNSYLLLRRLIRKYRRRYAYGIICLLGVGMVQTIIPKILGSLTDRFASGVLSTDALIRYIAAILFASALIAVGRYCWRMYVVGTSRIIAYDLRNSLYNHLQTLSARFYTQHKTGDLMAHATNDINAIRDALGRGIVSTVDSIFLSILTVTIMLRTIDWRLTVLVFIPLPLLVVLSFGFGRAIHRRFRRVQNSFSQLTDRVTENFAGIRVIKSFVQEKQETRKFLDSNQEYFDENISLVRVWALFHPLIQLVGTISFLVVLIIGGRMVMYGEISLGDFVAFNSYLGLLIDPMIRFGSIVNIWQRGKASMDRLNDLFAARPEVFDESKNPAEKLEMGGEIEIRNLTFSYTKAQPPVLQDINLRIPAGSTLAIIGRTGAGKSTLVNLLLRLYNPPRGTVFIDGRDIRDLPLKELRASIGYVPQDTFLFSASLEDNIGFGLDEEELAKTDVSQAAKAAQIHDDIMEFPNHYQTIIGERGTTLSGGQKQRVAIARAIIKNPKILILDDSLSAVDTNTEEKILNEMRAITRSRTTIVIAHRISTVKNADQIIVIDEGRIVERGTHSELLALGGLYKDIYEKQLLQEELQGA